SSSSSSTPTPPPTPPPTPRNCPGTGGGTPVSNTALTANKSVPEKMPPESLELIELDESPLEAELLPVEELPLKVVGAVGAVEVVDAVEELEVLFDEAAEPEKTPPGALELTELEEPPPPLGPEPVPVEELPLKVVGAVEELEAVFDGTPDPEKTPPESLELTELEGPPVGPELVLPKNVADGTMELDERLESVLTSYV
ncbi:MAG: hypothetical protein Q9168_004625, partial [Polycauliona sp. 1 TL-2023]